MIYTIGCSFTYGDELSDLSNAWPILLANKLRSKVFNDAISGGTNYRTMYRTTKHLRDNFDLYIIAWTSTARYTFYKSDNNYEINFNPALRNDLYQNEKFYANWGADLYRYWHNELYSFKLWLQQIIHLQSMLEHNQKKYLMINTMPNHLKLWTAPKDHFINSVKKVINFDILNDDQIFAEYEEINYYIKCINKKSFYKWNQFSIDSLTQKYPIGAGGHFLEEGHAHMADLLFQHLNDF